MDELNNRIVSFMVHSGQSKSTFARELGVSLPLITHITSGRNKPGVELLQRMLTVYPDLNPDWLLNGSGEMYRSQPKSVDLSEELARLEVMAERLTIPITSLDTVKAYHKLLLDEIMHLQEMDLEVQKVKDEIHTLTAKIRQLKKELESKVSD